MLLRPGSSSTYLGTLAAPLAKLAVLFAAHLGVAANPQGRSGSQRLRRFSSQLGQIIFRGGLTVYRCCRRRSPARRIRHLYQRVPVDPRDNWRSCGELPDPCTGGGRVALSSRICWSWCSGLGLRSYRASAASSALTRFSERATFRRRIVRASLVFRNTSMICWIPLYRPRAPHPRPAPGGATADQSGRSSPACSSTRHPLHDRIGIGVFVAAPGAARCRSRYDSTTASTCSLFFRRYPVWTTNTSAIMPLQSALSMSRCVPGSLRASETYGSQST